MDFAAVFKLLRFVHYSPSYNHFQYDAKSYETFSMCQFSGNHMHSNINQVIEMRGLYVVLI